jgi:glutaredoxin-related protein
LREGLLATENIECWLRDLIQLLKTMLMKGKSDEPCCGFGIKVVSNEGGRCGVWQLQYSQMRMFSK